jgi:hypothetical protein
MTLDDFHDAVLAVLGEPPAHGGSLPGALQL